MVISQATIVPCNLAKDDPTWAYARSASPATTGWIVRLLTDDGIAGCGYVSTSPHLGTPHAAAKRLLEDVTDALIGWDAFDRDALFAFIDAQLAGSSTVKAGIDCALHEVWARAQGLPLCDLLGGALRSSVPILRTMAIKAPKEMALQAQRLVDERYTYLKIKICGDMEADIASVEAIRQQVGPEIHLTVDANQSYTPKDAVTALNRMADLGVELAEQPVSVTDLDGLKSVTDSVPMIIEADEGANSLESIERLVSERIVDAVSLKIPPLGGLRNAVAAARICQAGGVGYRLGGAVGPRLLTAQAMHLCASLPAVSYACEFGEFVRLLGDPTVGVEVKDGSMALPEGVGSGASLIA